MAFRAILIPFILPCTLPAFGQAGAAFVENRGQWPSSVSFKADLVGASVWCERDGVLLDRYVHHHRPGDPSPHPRPTVTDHSVVHLTFLHTSPAEKAVGMGVQRGAYNYFIGDDPSQWASSAHGFSAVVQRELYPGIELRWRTDAGSLKYDLLLAPGADANVIALATRGRMASN